MKINQALAKIENLCFSYENGVSVLRNANLELFPGKIVGLVGPNGAGKTTLVNLISGRIIPQSGKIVFQKSNQSYNTNSFVAVVEQHLSLYEHLTVAQNICIKDSALNKLSLISEKKIEEDAQNILNHLKVDLPVSDIVSSLTFSQKQLVEIVKAIHRKSPILILDEPTSALDVSSKKALFAVLKKQAQDGYCILLVTHDTGDLEGLTNDVITIKDGYIERVENKIDLIPKLKMDAQTMDDSHDLSCYIEINSAAKSFSFGVNKGEVSVCCIEDALDRSLLGQSLIGMTNNIVNIEMFGQSVKADPVFLKQKGVKVLLSDRKNFNIFPNLSILQLYCLLTATKLPIFRRKQPIKEIDNRLTLSELIYPSLGSACLTLSGGNQQKLLWESMKNINGISFLVLEEPLLGLDIKSQERTLKEFTSLAHKGLGILILTCYGHLYKGHNAYYANPIDSINL